ncbi:MAG TPA: ATP-binding protein [Pyrinomonadaceae bacterium]|nr:ATP-binding protein [Pyrinomonadaceae bacterium]
MDKSRFAKQYMWSIVVLGSGITLLSIYQLPLRRLDFGFILLVAMVVISSQIAVRIPRVSGRITVSDTFVFLTMLLYGGAAAVLMSALEGVCSSLRISRRTRTILLNSAVLAGSTFVTVIVLRFFFGSPRNIVTGGYSANFFIAICVMALVQYAANTTLIAVEKSYKINESIWHTWKTYYLWTSITYFAGASAASIIARLIHLHGYYAVVATVPIVAIIYFTYRTYLKNVEASEAQAKLAHQHVEELSRYIAELKRSEEERGRLLLREQQARSEAEAANRIKDEFLATLSHELRTPLTALLGWASLLRGSQPEKAMLDQGLETIERNATVQAQLIDDLLDVSRIISGKLHLDVQPVDLTHVIETAISVVRPAAAAKSIQLIYGPNEEIGPISGDPARLQQVVWNLLSNAVKFTPEGGRIVVLHERVGSHAKITVNDNGQGINPELLPEVFDRFRQGDSSTTRGHGGLGLGLAIVRHLVELHGGTIHAESRGEGLGASFSVTFPLMAVRLDAVGLAQSARTAGSYTPALNGLRVLVVDDEPDARQIIATVIAQTGAEVRACQSVHEAMQMFECWRPDVLMSDIGMPGEDGYSLINRVRSLPAERGGQIPAAALTAYAREDDRKRVLAAGYQMHIAKPVTSGQLVSVLAHLAGCATQSAAI